jgi:hypothetical protein
MVGIPGDGDSTVARLAMIDVTWAYCQFALREGPEKRVWNQYSSLLTGLLALHEDAAHPGSPAGAWILHDPQLFDTEVNCAVKQPENRPTWCSGVEAQRVVGLIADGLEQCELASSRAWMKHQESLLAAQMNLFACRLYLIRSGPQG